MYLDNPPWADKAIRENAIRIKRAFGARAMPSVMVGRKYKEFDCGSYGCVYPTNLDQKVIKVTSDRSEISLIKYILKCPDIEDTQGIVRYYGLLPLHTTYRRRPVFAILREEAYDIGFLTRSRPDLDYRERRRINVGLRHFKEWASTAKRLYERHADKPMFHEVVERAYEWILKRWPDVEYLGHHAKGGERAALALVTCKFIAEDLAQTPEVYPVGETLGWFMCKGKLLADVHLGNIGLVRRAENYGEPTMAITDPGHAIDVMPVESWICT